MRRALFSMISECVGGFRRKALASTLVFASGLMGASVADAQMGPPPQMMGPQGIPPHLLQAAYMNGGVMPAQGYAQLPPNGIQVQSPGMQMPGMHMPPAQLPHHGAVGACPTCPSYQGSPATPIIPSQEGSSGESILQPTPEGGVSPEQINPGQSNNVPAPDFDVANLNGDVGYASAGQAAAPNMIGDTLGGPYCGTLTFATLATELPYCPSGGRTYRASTNNSPVPQSRVFYNFNHFHDAITFANNVDPAQNDAVSRHEFGFEWKLFSGLTSFQFVLPFSNSAASTINQDFGAALPNGTDTEFGNISFALKRVIYADPCRIVSVGLALDVPTANDVEISDTNGATGADLFIENKMYTLHPYLGWSIQPPCSNYFFQGFVQGVLPLNENPYDANFGGASGDMDAMPLFIADMSLGAWLAQDPCSGQGIAVVGELHYTTALESDTSQELLPMSIFYNQENVDILNCTAGVVVACGKWDATVGYAFPILDGPNHEAFSWEMIGNVNRRF